MASLLETRLTNQWLTDPVRRTPQQIVARLGAVQAQDYPGAAWALSRRSAGLTLADVDRALATGAILRTHVLRPTWHFVTPRDIRWMLDLTGPRVTRMLRAYDARLSLDARIYARSADVIQRTLEGGRELTRTELAAALRAKGIEASGQRLAHLVMHAELDALICSGGRRGQQFTYALLGERAPDAPRLPREEALATLAQRYFRSHGPATLRDFSWWSGLTMTDARQGAGDARLGSLLLGAPPARDAARKAHLLLPNYDEYLIAYRDRGAVLDPRHPNLITAVASPFPHQVVVDGRVAGSWRRTIGASSAEVSWRLYERAAPAVVRALELEVRRFGHFLGVSCSSEPQPA